MDAQSAAQKKSAGRHDAVRRFSVAYVQRDAQPQVEYLNSGIAFSSSLVALNTA